MVSAVLPALPALIGLGGFIIGLYSFVAPASAAQIYGVDLDQDVPIRAPSAASQKKTDDNKSRLQDSDGQRRLAYIHALGIRNFVIGMTILILTWVWQFGPHRSSPAEQGAVQKCLGIVISVGALTPVVDAVVTWRAGREERWNGVGSKAALLHAVRSLFWLAGGLWCLSGNAELY